MLDARGKKLSDVRLRHQGSNGNGIGVPGSRAGCLHWPTGRGNLLRNGMGPATAS